MTTQVALMILAAGTVLLAEPQQKVTVYIRDTIGNPGTVFIQAQALAGQMFAKIGVSLDWRRGTPPGGSLQTPILIELTTATPAHSSPDALAYALPYEGSHITVFFDRIAIRPYPNTLLAHVLVHEITHLLQGVNRHSATGIMKAFWTMKDYAAMQYSPFSFTPEDVELIYAGLAHRPGMFALDALAGARWHAGK